MDFYNILNYRVFSKAQQELASDGEMTLYMLNQVKIHYSMVQMKSTSFQPKGSRFGMSSFISQWVEGKGGGWRGVYGWGGGGLAVGGPALCLFSHVSGLMGV